MGFEHQCFSLKYNGSSSDMNNSNSLRAVMQGIRLADELICPQPQRMAFMACYVQDLLRPIHSRCSLPDVGPKCEAGCEVLEILQKKSGNENSANPDWSFSGSPPGRASNPLTRDMRFLQQGIDMSPVPSQPKPRRPTFHSTPSIQVEGFDCSGRDHSCTVPAFA